MFDLSTINSAKKQASQNYEQKAKDTELEFKEGLEYLSKFLITSDKELLNKASNKFFNVIKYKKNNVEPYFYISYIFYILNKKELAIEYLKIAESVEPSYPHLKNLRAFIYSM